MVVTQIAQWRGPELCDGRYPGSWSGETIRLHDPHLEAVTITTDIGVRGTMQVVVVVTRGEPAVHNSADES